MKRGFKGQECIGFGEFEGKCPNNLDGKSNYWCKRCDDLRMKHLTKCFEELAGVRKPA